MNGNAITGVLLGAAAVFLIAGIARTGQAAQAAGAGAASAPVNVDALVAFLRAEGGIGAGEQVPTFSGWVSQG